MLVVGIINVSGGNYQRLVVGLRKTKGMGEYNIELDTFSSIMKLLLRKLSLRKDCQKSA